ncbi:unnamed protein product [Symbiodinium sp. CCMP2592]|nr:unnamed protein product [Symbiodinium sp. CCMP2592]
MMLQTSHRRHEYKSMLPEEFNGGSYDQIFAVVPTHSTSSLSSLWSSSMCLDRVGGKTVENAAADILDTWATMQFQQSEEEPFVILHEPQPVQVFLPGLYIAQPADSERMTTTLPISLDSESETEGSDSSGFWDPPFYDASAGAAHVRYHNDRCGGSGVVLPVEVLGYLPSFYFEHDYLHALAAASSRMLSLVRDKTHWQDLVVDIDRPDLLVSARLRSMIDLLSRARWVCVNIHQLSMFLIIPANIRLNWTPTPVPRHSLPPFVMFGFQSMQPLLGVADFDIVLPAQLRSLVVGVREWHGETRFYCRIDNIFQTPVAWSLGMNNRPARPYTRASRFEFIVNRSNRFHLRWNTRFFSVGLNHQGVLRASVTAPNERLAPALSQVFIWGFGPQRPLSTRPRVAAVPSLLQLNASIRCAICHQEHTIMIPRWCVCPMCTTWVCASHVGESPWRRCPGCEYRLQDYLGGAEDNDGDSYVQAPDGTSHDWDDELLVSNSNLEMVSHNMDFLGGSVTGLIHQYAEEFEPAVALMKMKSGKQWPRPEYVDPSISLPSIAAMLQGMDFKYQADLVHLLRQSDPNISEICRLVALSKEDLNGWDEIVSALAMSDNEIMLHWDRKRIAAANSGTWMHAMLEHMLNGYKIQPGPMEGEMTAVIRFLSGLDNVEVYRTEWCICAPEEDLAGSIDLVLKDKDTDVFHLVDWKRSENLQDKYNSYGKKMAPPIQDVDDCQGQHYRLQLNIYKWILENYYDIKVQQMKVVCVHPRYLPHGLVDIVPDMQTTVAKMMQCCRNKKAAISMQNAERAEIGPGQAHDAPGPAHGCESLPPGQDSQGNIPDTLEFEVMLTGPPPTKDEMEIALEELMLEEEDKTTHGLAKKRRLMPGADTHALDCKNMFARSLDIIKNTLDTYGADVCLQPNTIMQNTRNMVSSLQTKYPWMSDQLKRLIMVAVHMTTGKIGDKPMLPDAAAITWMVEGDCHMRVHKGFLFIYDDDGCFMPFGGIPPEAVLHRVGDFFCCLEGIFRRMKPEIVRDAVSVANAIAADMQNFETESDYFTECRNATNKRSQTPAYSQRLDDDEEDVRGRNQSGQDACESWPLDMASRSWKVSCIIKQELMQTRMVSLLVEWCETEDRRSSTICYDDLCLAYDRPGSFLPVEVVKKGPQNNCYVRIPHPLLDPVMEANMDRLQGFYERTFWCNLDVFKCFQAAAAIAKRGFNVDRLEVNRVMAFLGVTNGNFNSMFRRSFVWKAKARFVHGKFLRHYPDHEKDGIFEADPSLSKFLSTSQASIAGLKLQWAFEVDHSKEDCYQLIEDYCNGGDGHLTEDIMRDACGLPVRVRQEHEEEGLGNVMAAGQDSADERDERDQEWIKLKNFLTTYMLEKEMDVMTFHEFKKMNFKPGQHPNLAKGVMWDQLEEKGVVRTALIRQKTSKEKPGAYIPNLIFSKPHADICPQAALDTVRLQFEEEQDIGLAKKYAHSCRGRSMNADTMKAFYKAMIPASKKGRRTAETEEIVQKYQSLIRKLEDHENCLQQIVSTKHGRRLRGKKSVEEDDHESVDHVSLDGKSWSSLKHGRTISYAYSEKVPYTVRARRYTNNGGVQSMSRRLQSHVVDGHTVDLDIQNCCLTLLQQIIAKVEPQPPMPDNLVKLLDRLVNDRTAVLNQLGLHIVEGKEMINTVLNGGSPFPALKNNEIVYDLQRLSQYVRWVACNMLHEDYMSLADNKHKTFPSSTILSLLWTSVEDRILQSWTEHILSRPSKPKHLSLHFDGLRISRDHIETSQDEFIKDCENAIRMRTGFMVKIVEKKHFSFIDLVKNRSTHANSVTNVPALLLQPGNCIPCAVWHMTPLVRPVVVAAISNETLEKNIDAKKMKYRDYRSVASMCSIDLASCVGLPESHVKSFVIHYEGQGVPHCLAVRVDAAGKNVTILDGATVYKLTMAIFREIHSAAVDHATMVSYWKPDSRDKIDGKSSLLLDMVAGAREAPHDSEEDTCDDVAEASAASSINRLSFDEDNVPVFSDNIMNRLSEEADFVMKVRAVSTRCHMAAFESNNKLASLLPRRSQHWMPMLEDIATSHAFLDKMESMSNVLMQQDEWHYISMDATLKLCMKLMGQASYRSPKAVRDEAPFGDDVAWRRLLTVRGRTGAVLLMHPLQNESSEQLVEALSQNFSTEQLQAVVHIGTDSPSEKLFSQLQSICPCMKSLILDPIHLAIVYEYGFWNKKSPGSKQLRRILKKCTAVDDDLGRDCWGPFYDGRNANPLGEVEIKYRDMISTSSMTPSESKNILDKLDMQVPFSNRLEFIKALAALCQRYPNEVNKKIAGANKQINKILWSACSPDRLEWMMNNLRVRHAIQPSYRWFLPSGTSSNEALHAEVNSWTRSITAMHRSTLAMKLMYFRYIKLLLHYLSVQHPLSHVVSASMLLSRSLHASLWYGDDWTAWCSEQSSETVPKKAALPLSSANRHEAKLVRQHLQKKPACKGRKNHVVKRRVTPLSVKRMHTLRSAGVKSRRRD